MTTKQNKLSKFCYIKNSKLWDFEICPLKGLFGKYFHTFCFHPKGCVCRIWRQFEHFWQSFPKSTNDNFFISFHFSLHPSHSQLNYKGPLELGILNLRSKIFNNQNFIRKWFEFWKWIWILLVVIEGENHKFGFKGPL